jgi:hypothetical protein
MFVILQGTHAHPQITATMILIVWNMHLTAMKKGISAFLPVTAGMMKIVPDSEKVLYVLREESANLMKGHALMVIVVAQAILSAPMAGYAKMGFAGTLKPCALIISNAQLELFA